MKLIRSFWLICLVLSLVFVPNPAAAQVDCAQLVSQADSLLTQAATSLAANDLVTAQALVSAARAMLVPCVTAGVSSCTAIGQADTVLGQIETASDVATASTLLSGAQALLDSCITTSATPETGNLPPVPTLTPVSSSNPTNGLIVYTSGPLSAQGFPTKTDIFVMNRDGTGIVQLTSDGTAASPAWSPYGTQIAYQAYGTSTFDIFVMNADGSGQTNLTNGQAGSASTPTWSPDGRYLLFKGSPSSDTDIYVMAADGSGLRNLTNSPSAYETDPAWSPDGSQIAFVSDQAGSEDVWLINVDGSNLHNLTAQTDAYRQGHERKPAWSPNGVMIAFQYVNAEGISSISLAKADLTGGSRLIVDFGMVNNPTWSPDGTRLAFTSNQDGDNEIYVVAVDSNELTFDTVAPEAIQQLTSNEDWDAVGNWQPIGSVAVPVSDPAPFPLETAVSSELPRAIPTLTMPSDAAVPAAGQSIVNTLPGGFPSGSIQRPGVYDNGAIQFEFPADWHLSSESNFIFPHLVFSSLPSVTPEESRQQIEAGAMSLEIYLADPRLTSPDAAETPAEVISLMSEASREAVVEYNLPNGRPVARVIQDYSDATYQATVLAAIENDHYVLVLVIHRSGESALVLPIAEMVMDSLAYDPTHMMGVPPAHIEVVDQITTWAEGTPFRFIHTEWKILDGERGAYCLLVDPPIGGQNAFVIGNTNPTGSWQMAIPVSVQWAALGCPFAEAIVTP